MAKKYRYLVYLKDSGNQYNTQLFDSITERYSTINSSDYRSAIKFSFINNVLVLDATAEFAQTIIKDSRVQLVTTLTRFTIDSNIEPYKEDPNVVGNVYDYWYYREIGFDPQETQKLVTADVYIVGTGINSTKYQNVDETASCVASTVIGVSGKKNNVNIIDVNCLKFDYNTQDILYGMDFILGHHIKKRFAGVPNPSIAIFPELDEITLLVALELTKNGIFCISGPIDKTLSLPQETMEQVHREILLVNAYDRYGQAMDRDLNPCSATDFIFNISAPGEVVTNNYIPYKTMRFDTSKNEDMVDSKKKYRIMRGTPAALGITGYIVATLLSKRYYTTNKHIRQIISCINLNAEFGTLDYNLTLYGEDYQPPFSYPAKKIKMVTENYGLSFENENFNSFLWLAGMVKVPVHIAVVWNELQASGLPISYNGILLPNGMVLEWDGYIACNRYNCNAQNLLWLESEDFKHWIDAVHERLIHPFAQKSFMLPQGAYLYEKMRLLSKQIVACEEGNVYSTPEGNLITFDHESYRVIKLN